jgi:hypothetical protein
MEIFFVKPVFNMISRKSIWMTFWLSCILHYCFIYDINAWEIWCQKVNLNKIVWSGKNVWYQIIFCYARDWWSLASSAGGLCWHTRFGSSRIQC